MKKICANAPRHTCGSFITPKSGANRSITPWNPWCSVIPRTMSTTMNSHIRGTNRRVACSMLSAPVRVMTMLRIQMITTNSTGIHPESMWKK